MDSNDSKNATINYRFKIGKYIWNVCTPLYFQTLTLKRLKRI